MKKFKSQITIISSKQKRPIVTGFKRHLKNKETFNYTLLSARFVEFWQTLALSPRTDLFHMRALEVCGKSFYEDSFRWRQKG